MSALYPNPGPKYEFVEGDTKKWYGRTLRRIRALISFGVVVKGEFGGYIEAESNCALDGNAWVSGDARVSGDADYLTAGPIGSRSSHITFCVDAKLKLSVCTGCFFGSLRDFETAVDTEHGDNIHGRIYRALLDWVRLVFRERGKELPGEQSEQAA